MKKKLKFSLIHGESIFLDKMTEMDQNIFILCKTNYASGIWKLGSQIIQYINSVKCVNTILECVDYLICVLSIINKGY